MEGFLVGAGMALWLGILTSISPCPLATNIVAISYIGKRGDNMRYVALSGLSYALGRTLVYVAIGAILVASVLSVQEIALFLQKYMNQILGPVLILAGMLLLDLIKLNFAGGNPLEKAAAGIKRDSARGAGLLGVIFALSFCPISAALFFGGLIPLSLKEGSSFMFPMLYGIGTALPVVLFALLVAFGASYVSRVFDRIRQLEAAARRFTGILFVAVGIFYCLRYIFGVF
jgi:cytochrome c biogenesis protein CcdA